jgi:hypothetical protein
MLNIKYFYIKNWFSVVDVEFAEPGEGDQPKEGGGEGENVEWPN